MPHHNTTPFQLGREAAPLFIFVLFCFGNKQGTPPPHTTSFHEGREAAPHLRRSTTVSSGPPATSEAPLIHRKLHARFLVYITNEQISTPPSFDANFSSFFFMAKIAPLQEVPFRNFCSFFRSMGNEMTCRHRFFDLKIDWRL